MLEKRFRAWNKKEKKWHVPTVIDGVIDYDISVRMNGEIYSEEIRSKNVTDNYDLLQYTGIKDVNKKNI